MLPSETLWPTTRPPAFERVGSTQPFNYRDTLTLLDYVNQVVAHIQSVQSDVDSDMGIIDGDVQTMQDALSGMLLDMANLRDELINMIKQAAASDNIMVWSPAYGNQVPAQLAVEDTYDANRIFGLFAGDFDDLTMSPADFDALEVSPREFDLRSTDAINAVRGDITRNDIWWLKEHGLTFGDLIAMAQESAASASASQSAAAQSATTAAASQTAAAQSATTAAASQSAAAQSASSASASQSAVAQSAASASASQSAAAQSAASASASQSAAAQSATSATASQTAAAQSATTAVETVANMSAIMLATNESDAMTKSAANPTAWVFYPEGA